MESETIFFDSKLTAIGNKNNPSYYIKVPKKMVTDNLILKDAIFKVSVSDQVMNNKVIDVVDDGEAKYTD